MKIHHILSIFLLFQLNLAIASDDKNSNNYKEYCLKDIDFIRKNIIENSATFKNIEDTKFQEWFEPGYEHTKKLIDGIRDVDDCYYALKFYLNKFDSSHISLRGTIKLPDEKYPGLLTAKYGNHHIVIYKNNNVSYLEGIDVGDQLTHINEMKVEDYFKEYTLPFYANGNSEFIIKSASIYNLIVDGNPYVPIPVTATFSNKQNEKKLTLQYTELVDEALLVARNIRQPAVEKAFNIKMISAGVWITIPSFYLSTEESVFYSGMLSKLRTLAKEDYIVFDLRGNRGGATKWSRPLIRNLWGDPYLKSLGSKHDYNNTWVKKVRVSKENFVEFKKTSTPQEIRNFATALEKKEDYFEKKWKIYSEDMNLYSNKDISPFKAKIFVLTDHFCRSTCFTFVSELLQIPGVTHIGIPTAIQTRYSYARKTRTPSDYFDFFYPTEIRIYPNRDIDKSLIPSQIFTGDIRNESEIMDWVLSIAEG